MKSLLTEEGYQEIKGRIDQLTENAEKGWGKNVCGSNVLALSIPAKISNNQ